MIPVNAPRSSPFSFPFPPVMYPPINKLKKDIMVTNN